MVETHIRSYDNLAPLIGELRAYVTESGFTLRRDTPLGRMFAAFDEVNEARSAGRPATADRAQMVDYGNLCVLAALAGRIRDTGDQVAYQQLALVLKKSDPALLSAGPRSQFRDKLFELMCGATCAAFADSVAYEEPDLSCIFAGEELLLACKCIYGGPKTAVKAIRTGWRQVKTRGRGYVLVHLIDRYPHEKLMRSIAAQDGFASVEDLQAESRALFIETSRPYERALIDHLNEHPQEDRRKVRAVNYLAHTVGMVRGTPMAFGFCTYQAMAEGLVGRLEPDAFSRAFHTHWEHVL